MAMIFPHPGNYIRIGYFCENIIPDLSICEWAFGVMPEDKFNSPEPTRGYNGTDSIPKNLLSRLATMHRGC